MQFRHNQPAKRWLCLSFMVLLVSCRAATPEATPSPVPTRIIDFTLTAPPSALPTATATAPPSATITRPPTASSAPTRRPTSTPTATVTPIAAGLADAEIRELLQDRVACPPPCYLGVVPGQTTVPELRARFDHWAIQLAPFAQSYNFSYTSTSHDRLEATFFTRANVVESVEFATHPDEPLEWAAYSPIALLEHFGPPSQVSFWISTIHEPTPAPWRGWYNMAISYDELNLTVQYSNAEMRIDQALAAVCPRSNAYQGARVWLGEIPPGRGEVHSYNTPLEVAASITVNEFHDYLLLGPGACFNIDLRRVVFP